MLPDPVGPIDGLTPKEHEDMVAMMASDAYEQFTKVGARARV